MRRQTLRQPRAHTRGRAECSKCGAGERLDPHATLRAVRCCLPALPLQPNLLVILLLVILLLANSSCHSLRASPASLGPTPRDAARRRETPCDAARRRETPRDPSQRRAAPRDTRRRAAPHDRDASATPPRRPSPPFAAPRCPRDACATPRDGLRRSATPRDAPRRERDAPRRERDAPRRERDAPRRQGDATPRGERVPRLAMLPNCVDVGRIRAKCITCPPHLADSGPHLVKIGWPISTQIRLRADFGRKWQNSGRIWSIASQPRPVQGQLWPTSANTYRYRLIRLNPAGVGPISVQVDRLSANVGRCPSGLAPELGKQGIVFPWLCSRRTQKYDAGGKGACGVRAAAPVTPRRPTPPKGQPGRPLGGTLRDRRCPPHPTPAPPPHAHPHTN